MVGAKGKPLKAGARNECLATAITASAKIVETVLDQILPAPHGRHARVHEAMRYAVFAGGKRLRPYLVLSSAGLFDSDSAGAARVAAAVEVLHTYSLVHDDLPCMDDDDLRRGRPTTHVMFDEATAVLAGDALLTLAFEILAEAPTHPSANTRCALVRGLALAAGSNGMIGGQMIDMGAAASSFAADDVIQLQRLKTGALFEFACRAGAILAKAGAQHEERLGNYAHDLGLAFQIADDLLDVLSTKEKTGKSVGKDKQQGKATLVDLMGVEKARAEAERLARQAAATLKPYGAKASHLRDLPLFLLDRES